MNPQGLSIIEELKPASPGNNGGDNGGTLAPKGKGIQRASREIKNINPLPPRLLSLKNAARYMGRTVWGMRELYWASKIPMVKDGKKIYFDVRDLDAYIDRFKSTFA